MRESPLLQFADPDVICRVELLADDDNALELWRVAAEKLIRPDEIDNLSAWSTECDCQQADCLACHPLEPHEFERQAGEILRENAESLRLCHAGLERGGLQIRVAPPIFDDERFSLTHARSLCRLLSLAATLSRCQDDKDEAVTAIGDLLKYGRMVAESGLLVQFLVGVAIQGVALSRAAELAKDQLAGPDAKRLLGALDQILDANVLVEVIRREHCVWAIPTVEQMPSDGVVAKVVDKLIEHSYPNRPMLPTTDRNWKDDGRFARRREQILSILQDHPNPWDANDAARLMNENVLAQIAAVRNPTAEAAAASVACGLDMPNHWWPSALSPAVHYEYLGASEDARAARVELAKLMGIPPKEFKLYNPLTTTELAEWREKLRQIDNPLGRLLAESLCTYFNGGALERLNDRAASVRHAVLERVES